MQENKIILKQFRERHLFGIAYFVSALENITDEVIMEYVETQEDKETDDGLTAVE